MSLIWAVSALAGLTQRRRGRPGYRFCDLLKLYIHGSLNRVQSSRRLGREAGRNVGVMWQTGRPALDHKLDVFNPRSPDEAFANEDAVIDFRADHADIDESNQSILRSGWLDDEPLFVVEGEHVIKLRALDIWCRASILSSRAVGSLSHTWLSVG